MSVFTELPQSSIRVGASGHIMSARQAADVLDAGFDFVMIGKAAVLYVESPRRAELDHGYCAPRLTVREEYSR